MSVRVREAAPADYPGLAAVGRALGDARTARALRAADAAVPRDVLYRRFVAEEGGRVVGHALLDGPPWSDRRAGVAVAVAPDARRAGVGTALLAAVEVEAALCGVTRLAADLPEAAPDALGFAGARGFRAERRTLEGRLDLPAFDPAPFAPALERAARDGLRFLSFARLRGVPEPQRQIYDLQRRCADDIPGFDGDFEPYEDFCRSVFEAPWFRRLGQFLALDGDRIVAVTTVGRGRRAPFHAFTGVHPGYRGRGLALALKVLGATYARELGAPELLTWNDAENASILALNRRLGYRVAAATRHVAKDLAG